MTYIFRKCDLGHRMWPIVVIGTFVLQLLMLVSQASARDFPSVIDQVRPGVVGVGTAYPPRPSSPSGSIAFHGTGFVVGNGLQIATTLNVLPTQLDGENGQSLAVFTGHGTQSNARSARLVQFDEGYGLALLEVDGEPLPTLALGSSRKAREGQSIAFTGFPLGLLRGLYPATHRGFVASISPLAPPAPNADSLTAAQINAQRNTFSILQLDAIYYPGNSGSPVYDADSGLVLGVLNSTLVRKPGESAEALPPGIGFAIPAELIQQLLDKADAGS